jgi:hypothetical protein
MSELKQNLYDAASAVMDNMRLSSGEDSYEYVGGMNAIESLKEELDYFLAENILYYPLPADTCVREMLNTCMLRLAKAEAKAKAAEEELIPALRRYMGCTHDGSLSGAFGQAIDAIAKWEKLK